MFDTRSLGAASFQKKSYSGITPVDLSFADFLIQGGNFDLAAYEAIRLYMSVMPFFNAVDLRARLFAQVPIRVWDKKAEKWIDDHDSAELLAMPNADKTQNEFLTALASFYDITGNSYIVATGRPDMPPLELAAISPQRISFGSGQRFGFLNVPDVIWVNTLGSGGLGRLVFRAQETRNGIVHRATAAGAGEDELQLWHVRQFNPLQSTARFTGMSRASPIYLELQQYASGNTSNLSNLKRGTRISMAWVNNRAEELTEAQWERMQEEAQKYAGDANTGGTPILDGMDVKEIGTKNRDMQFKELQEAVLSRISIQYGVPLALMLSQSMTLNNLETSYLQLYDGAVIPLINVLYPELTRFLMPRYKGSENLEFRFNPHDIEALKVRSTENAKREKDIGATSIDELRAELGRDPIDGGDVVLHPASNVPLGTSLFDSSSDSDEEAAKSRFVAILAGVKDEAGNRKYSDDEIQQIAERNGLAAVK